MESEPRGEEAPTSPLYGSSLEQFQTSASEGHTTNWNFRNAALGNQEHQALQGPDERGLSGERAGPLHFTDCARMPKTRESKTRRSQGTTPEASQPGGAELRPGLFLLHWSASIWLDGRKPRGQPGGAGPCVRWGRGSTQEHRHSLSTAAHNPG